MIVEYKTEQMDNITLETTIVTERLDTDNLDNDSGDPWSLESIKKYLADVDQSAKNIEIIQQ